MRSILFYILHKLFFYVNISCTQFNSTQWKFRMMRQSDKLHIDNQLCFPLYACAKEIVRQYRKPLEPLNLTYTQYIVMMVLWEYDRLAEWELGQKVHLDSGTLAPLLKRLEKQGYISRTRMKDDERCLLISLTQPYH